MSNIGGQFYGTMARDRQIASIDEAIADAVRAADYILVLTAFSAVVLAIGISISGTGFDRIGDIALLAIIALSLRRYRSRFVAIGLLIYALIGMSMFVLWVLFPHTGPMPPPNIISVLLSINAVRTTFAVASAERLRLRWQRVVINAALCFAYLVMFYGIIGFLCIWANLGIDWDPSDGILLVLVNFVFLGTAAIIGLVGLQLLPFTRRVVNWVEPIGGQNQDIAPEAAPSAG